MADDRAFGSLGALRREFVKGCAAMLGGVALTTSSSLFSSTAAAAGMSDQVQTQANAVSAAELVATVRQELADIDKRIQNHAYLQALRKGKVSVAALKAFPGHEYHTVISDLRSMAQLVQRFGDQPQTAAFFNGILQGEIASRDAIVVFARKLGMTEAELQTYEVTSEGFAYPTFMAWESLNGSAAAIACGILVNFAAWGHNCGEMSRALQAKYGFSAADTVFLDSFANLPSFEEETLVIIQDGLDQGVDPREIHRSARLYQAYEKMFWDVLATIAKVA